MRCTSLVVLTTLALLPDPAPAVWKADTVKIWAQELGDELWRLSEGLTKSDQIRVKYKQMNASVKKKDGTQILESSLRSVSTMLTRKINAVKCIHATAESLAQTYNYSSIQDPKEDEYDYCEAKYSTFNFEDGYSNIDKIEKFPEFAKNRTHFSEIDLEKDSHFYNISVNTNTSCVHVPTNIFYQENKTLDAILWSKGLNDIFIRNYKSDPSLSWQYFGSSRGVLRFYPGMPWNTHGTDTYDCRVKSWYIEAATCSKDVIILFDVSGSMTGFKNYVARRTLRSLLDTLSNNDYVNVYTFKNITQEVVKCFVDLVQATPENLDSISNTLQPVGKKMVHKYPLEGYANLTTAYIKAFQELKKRRTHCTVSSTQGCNQMVMVITDYVPGNLTEVFEEYNRETVNNKTYTPVRVFTYLIGKEVTNVQEIQWMACLNRGYFVHIHSVEEVQQQVLKYINVIARPMILSQQKPPPTWTHANMDYTRTREWEAFSETSSDVDKPDEDKLVTSVAIPAFDYKHNAEQNDAILLGVAGTDVPIDSIAKLAQPHQLGVNGYSFIVSNNGYLLLHPLLITSINDQLQKNYNSVDFVEVEQVDDGKGSRELGEKIKQLREYLVNGDEGNMDEVEVLFHYDQMRRIARVKHDYYFNDLKGTPFSMGISLPRGYGDTELYLKDNPLEAKQGQELTGINVTDYFKFSYRVHPDWVYCKYHYLEGHETDSAEEEIWNFLVKISQNDLDITKKQYAEDTKTEEFDYFTHCENNTRELGKDDYYCNEDLVKQLVFDAKLTAPYFGSWEASEKIKALARKYAVDVRFVATASGLTRWHYVFEDSKNEKVDAQGIRQKEYSGHVFGDLYYKSIEEMWYKAAVLQHMINTESLVISTPLPILDEVIKKRPSVKNEDDDITLTASYAIFYKDGNSETPASVVGFQFSYNAFYDVFEEVTKRGPDGTTELTCNSEKYVCYIIDSSGYVVLSTENSTDVGLFFGVVQRGVMQSFIDKKVFDHVEVFNYQALCPVSMLPEPNSAWSLTTPLNLVHNIIRWILTESVILLFDVLRGNTHAFAASVQNEDDDDEYLDLISKEHPDQGTTERPPVNKSETIQPQTTDEELFSCDHSIILYMLNRSYIGNMLHPIVYEDDVRPCHPPYWASYITKTNLMLVVVDREWQFPERCPSPQDTKPRATKDSTTSREPCHKLDLARLKRRRLDGCFTYSDNETRITACGKGTSACADRLLLIITLALASTFTALLL